MIAKPSSSNAAAKASNSAKKKSPPLVSSTQSYFSFLQDPVLVDSVLDEQAESLKHQRLVRRVTSQSIAIAILSFLLLLASPFAAPVYQYYLRNNKSELVQLVPLTMPNMTNRAILSWATTSVTEIMTVGFGDYEQKLKAQRPRFTPEGWDAFAKAFDRQKIGEAFKNSQLVLTTVPSNTPVIVMQGVNEKQIYQWRVQMPVIMTYATNNNVNRHEKAVIDLTIIRVKPEQNPSGIGIDTWTINN